MQVNSSNDGTTPTAELTNGTQSFRGTLAGDKLTIRDLRVDLDICSLSNGGTSYAVEFDPGLVGQGVIIKLPDGTTITT